MTQQQKIADAMLQEWGTRLFYGMPKKAKQAPGGAAAAGAIGSSSLMSASAVRKQLRAAVRPHAKQVMVKITGGGAGMKAVTAHLRYISRQGKPEVGGRGQTLDVEDETGDKIVGAKAIAALADDWRVAGSYIPDESHRREVFNIMLSMPAGTPPEHVRDSARAFAKENFEGHKYAFVLHEDTNSPHVHLAVRAERMDGVRLNPRKADLRRWREQFAAHLQDRGVNAVATHAWTRGGQRATQQIWRLAAEPGKVRKPRPVMRSKASLELGRRNALEAWQGVAQALAASVDPADRELAKDVVCYVGTQFGAPEMQKDLSRKRGDIEPTR